ncbi:MAG: type II 3-dehydroquinate dehydratase [Opitutales bacterium]|nr:type II 3-dehydroquinate dehydratase [Opitutales bacterium]NRA26438.1 type II 3-dehydroquinate dehydratase [Opitutales bacterium]
MDSAPKSRIAIINGPNLNHLGKREPEIYGSMTLSELETECVALGKELGSEVVCFQSNHEGALIDFIYKFASEGGNALVINAGAFTHTSIALRDCVSGVKLPCIEVHISNVHSREKFRHTSHLSDISKGVICGLGIEGYRAAIRYLSE